jgi:hypothetical protein
MPVHVIARNKSTSSKDETGEDGKNHTALVQTHTATALQTVKSSRKKHRGTGKGDAEARQELPLSLPLVYGHLEGDGQEEQHGH